MTHVSYDHPLWLLQSDERVGQLAFRMRVMREIDEMLNDLSQQAKEEVIETSTDIEVLAHALRKIADKLLVKADQLREADSILKELGEP